MAKSKRKKRPPKKDTSIEITRRQLWEAREGIIRLLKSPELNHIHAWRIRKLLEPLQALQNEHIDLVAEHAIGEPKADGTIDIRDRKDFNEKWFARLDEPLGEKIIPLLLEGVAKVGLTPLEMITLEFMIIDPEPPGDNDVETDDDP